MAKKSIFNHWPTMLLGFVVAAILVVAVFSFQLPETRHAVVIPHPPRHQNQILTALPPTLSTVTCKTQSARASHTQSQHWMNHVNGNMGTDVAHPVPVLILFVKMLVLRQICIVQVEWQRV